MKGSPTFRKRQVRAPDHLQWIEAESSATARQQVGTTLLRRAASRLRSYFKGRRCDSLGPVVARLCLASQ